MYKGYKTYNGDLTIENGDFVKGKVANDQIVDILALNQGDLREFPLLGTNLMQFKNAPLDHLTIEKVESRIRLNLEASGYQVGVIQVNNLETLKIDAKK